MRREISAFENPFSVIIHYAGVKLTHILQCSNLHKGIRIPAGAMWTGMNQIQYLELLEESRIYLDTQQAECDQEFRLNQFNRMDYEQETGRMIFSDVGVIPRVVADYQIVGSLSGRTNTWLWAWDNPYLLENTIQDIWEVKEFGDINDIEKLKSPKWEATEQDAWDMTAIAAYLLKARGAYSFLLDDIRVFVIFTRIKTIDGV